MSGWDAEQAARIGSATEAEPMLMSWIRDTLAREYDPILRETLPPELARLLEPDRGER